MGFSILGFMLLNIALVHYFSKLKKSQTPKNAKFLKFTMITSSVLSLWAISELFNQSTTTVNTVTTIVFSLLVLSISATFSFFLATRKTPVGDLKVNVNDAILPFKTSEFDSESLQGKRTLLKFYRGSWCPYCSAELIMFEALQPKLAEYGVDIVGISNDSVADIEAHLVRDNISHTLISDSKLDIIRQYGVEHHKALSANANDTINVFGIAMPMPWKMKYRPMAIPTSLLIDESGKIVWIDQSDDYRLRASEDSILSALKANFSSNS
jgi:peroxiredoxin